jgi:hypothetical protein
MTDMAELTGLARSGLIGLTPDGAGSMVGSRKLWEGMAKGS